MGVITKLIGGVLGKIPLDRLIGLGLRFGLFKKPLELLVKGWRASRGARTQVLLVLAGLLAAGGAWGYIPQIVVVGDVTLSLGALISAILGLSGATGIDKIERLLPLIQAASEEVAKEAEKAPVVPLEAPKEPPQV